ncbi:hypothetical protein SAMN04488120_10615 [Fontimonas thermophila]|uniref:Uncharacterized protein n=1 Tax=Fontimonas thermophila TaxID=1076937 RepID=A0A1I2JB50_9GAMM|nr:hypothetical protein [Fontimonas thermophila]SFF50417.1 hypothetical protein SAMN04488120_10615 [Fontimonas thermophila]
MSRDACAQSARFSPTPATWAACAAEDAAAQRLWFNVLVAAGHEAEIQPLQRVLGHAQVLPWRSAEEVEREVVYLALRRCGRRIETLDIEDVLRACEEVEARHLIEDGAIARHFRSLWHISSAYCRYFMRGLLARRPGDVAAAVRASAAGGPFREGFSLARIVLPPYRVLQGSYRYAGRSWCRRHWGTPEDAQRVTHHVERVAADVCLAVYQFETVDGAPVGVLRRLGERYAALAFGWVAVEAGSGQRCAGRLGRQAPAQFEPLAAVPMTGGGLRACGYVETLALARELALSRLVPHPGDAHRVAA